MSEPQVWALIGVFAASMFGVIGLIIPLVNRATTTAVDGVREAMEAGFDRIESTMNARFEAVDARFEAVDARFEAVNTRLDHLDRDVSMLMRREFGRPD